MKDLKDSDNVRTGSTCAEKVFEPVTFRDALSVWLRISLNSFGGPAAQIAVMHRYLVEEKKWISEERFLHALNYCMLLPGPEAQQLAIYIGWLLHRTMGGIAAGTLFVLPGFVVMLLLSIVYTGYQTVNVVQWLFFGLKPAVLAIVLEAVVRIGSRALKTRLMFGLAAASFVAIFVYDIPFPLIVISAGVFGFVVGHFRPEIFRIPGIDGGTKEQSNFNQNASEMCHDNRPAVDILLERGELPHVRPSLSRFIKIFVLWTSIWFGPVLLIFLCLGAESVYFQQAIFFSKTAVVTFGGAYAVLAYVAQQAVDNYGWLKPGEMLDGLGLAETTPGPLILVLQFVGFLAAYRDPGGLSPVIAGIFGAVLTVWVTFVPCFLFIFLGAPYIELLRENRGLKTAMSCVTAAVVGVVLNLAAWFTLNTLFGSLTDVYAFGAHLQVPVLHSVNLSALVISIVAMLAVFVFKIGMIRTILGCAMLGIVYHLLYTVT